MLKLRALSPGLSPAAGLSSRLMLARLFVAQAQAAGQSAALLFVDVKAAFCSVWPEIAVGWVLTEQQRASIFRAAGIPPEQLAALTSLICEEDTALRR